MNKKNIYKLPFLMLLTQKENVISSHSTSWIYRTHISEKAKLVTFIVCIVLFATLIFIIRLYVVFRTKKYEQLKEEYRAIAFQTVECIAKTIDAKDPNTNGHSRRVAQYAVAIGKHLNFTSNELESLYYTALMHDIGKIGIPDFILQKPCGLTDDEYHIMKQHPNIGAEILKDIPHIHDLVVGAKYHHEKFDGTGYNKGLKGDDIPLTARIIGVADSFDTMTSDRPYHKGMSKEQGLSELLRCSGTQFDPILVEVMIKTLNEKK